MPRRKKRKVTKHVVEEQIEPVHETSERTDQPLSQQATEQPAVTLTQQSQYHLSPEIILDEHVDLPSEVADGGHESTESEELSHGRSALFSPTFDSCVDEESDEALGESESINSHGYEDKQFQANSTADALINASLEILNESETTNTVADSQTQRESVLNGCTSHNTGSQVDGGVTSQLSQPDNGMFSQIVPVRSRRRTRGIKPAILAETTRDTVSKMNNNLLFSPCQTREQAVSIAVPPSARAVIHVISDLSRSAMSDVDSDATSLHAFESHTETDPNGDQSDERPKIVDMDHLTFVHRDKPQSKTRPITSIKPRPSTRIKTFSDDTADETAEDAQPIKQLRFLLNDDDDVEDTNRPVTHSNLGFDDFDPVDEVSVGLGEPLNPIETYIEKPTLEKPYIWEPHEIDRSSVKRLTRRRRSSKQPKFKETSITMVPADPEVCFVPLGDDLISDSDDSDFVRTRVKRTKATSSQPRKQGRMFRIGDMDREVEHVDQQQPIVEDSIVDDPMDMDATSVESQINSIQRHLRVKRYSGGSQPITSMIALPMKEVDSTSENDSPDLRSSVSRTKVVSNYFPMSGMSQVH